MAVLAIPVRNDLLSYEFTIELDLVNYLLRFRFNQRMDRWMMGIAKTDGTDIVSSIPLLPNVDLFSRFESNDLPPGAFIAFDQTGNQQTASQTDLGTIIQVLYFDEAELSEF